MFCRLWGAPPADGELVDREFVEGHEFERDFDSGFVSQSVAVSQPDWAGGEPPRRPVRRGSECLVENMGEVGLGGPWRDTELHADLPVGATAEQQVDHFVLGAGEARPSEDRPPLRVWVLLRQHGWNLPTAWAEGCSA